MYKAESHTFGRVSYRDLTRGLDRRYNSAMELFQIRCSNNVTYNIVCPKRIPFAFRNYIILETTRGPKPHDYMQAQMYGRPVPARITEQKQLSYVIVQSPNQAQPYPTLMVVGTV